MKLSTPQHGLVAHALTWLGVITIAVLAEQLLGLDQEHLLGVYPKPMLVNPALAALAALGGIATVMMAGVWAASTRQKSSYQFALLVLFSATTLAALAVAVRPGRGNWIVRERIPYEPPPAPANTFGLPIFFANGEHLLDARARTQLAQAKDVFADCSTQNISVHGYASSAPFRNVQETESAAANMRLANRRAHEVAKVMGLPGDAAVYWVEPVEMDRAKRIQDTREGQRLLPEEALNRRVDILWQRSPCPKLLGQVRAPH